MTTLILTTKKTKHFLFLKCLKKCNFYFKMLLKCFEIDSKCNAMLGMIKSTFELKNKTCCITLGVDLRVFNEEKLDILSAKCF